LPPHIEPIDLDHAIEGLFPPNHQAQGMAHAPGRRLADAKRFGQADRGEALVRLQHQPETREPHPKRELGCMKRCAGRDRELRATVST
jgi:hypothetical protein